MAMTHQAEESAAAWLRTNGIDPSTVSVDSSITVSTRGDGTRVITYREFQRSENGDILADPDGSPATRLRQTPLLTTDTPDTEPWTVDHKVTVFAQTRTRPGPVLDGGERWAEHEYTGLMLAVCNCGLNTGWLPRDQVTARYGALVDGEQHPAVIAATAERTGT